MISVLLIEHNELWRSSLSAVISNEKDIQEVSEFAHVTKAISKAATLRHSDVAIISIDTKNNNLVHIHKLSRALPNCRILALAEYRLAASISEAFGTYVHGFVSHDIAPSLLAAYIRKVANGEIVIEPAMAVATVNAKTNPLTKREKEVLSQAIDGKTNKEIAQSLFLAEGSVRNYLSKIIAKTGARTRIEAVKIAENYGWL